MSNELDVKTMVYCPIMCELYPYSKCRKCKKYRETFEKSEFDDEIEIVRMWCDYV